MGAACTRGDPPHVSAVDSVEQIPPPPPQSIVVDAGAEEAPPVDPGTLPQTHDMPGPTGSVEQRAQALFEAIVKDDPDHAMPFFFPITAYRQTKAVTNPDADWKHRLVKNYTRDIHALHEKLGSKAPQAVFIGLDVPTERAHWVDPGEEGNKTGYYRVYTARLRYEVAGRSSAFDITSMISWRGEWYVVHLSGFK